MNKSIYSILNDEAKSWLYHSQLRKQGKTNEARKLERESIRRPIKNIRDVLTHCGYLSLGRKQWSLQVFEHCSTSGLGTISYSVQGYYSMNKQCYLETICQRLGIPIKDSRLLTEDEAWDYIKLPMIGKKRDQRPEGNNSFNYVDLKTFVNIAKDKFPTFKFSNI